MAFPYCPTRVPQVQGLQAELKELQRAKEELTADIANLQRQAAAEQLRLTQEAARREAALVQKSAEEVAAVSDKYLVGADALTPATLKV